MREKSDCCKNFKVFSNDNGYADPKCQKGHDLIYKKGTKSELILVCLGHLEKPKCEDYKQGIVPTLDELKEKFSKPRVDIKVRH